MANTYSLDLEASSSQYASITDASQTGLDITGDITIEAWVKFESLPSNGNGATFVSKWETTTNQRGYVFYLYNNAGTYELTSGISTDGTDANRETDFVTWTPSTGTWYHIAVVYDVGTNVKYFVNGSQQGSTQTVTKSSIVNSSAAFAIGSLNIASTPAFLYDGLIDEVRVWSAIRSDAEISANYDKIISPSSSNLVGYWRLENNYLDETSNNNDLTASGSPVFSSDVQALIDISPSLNTSYFYFM